MRLDVSVTAADGWTAVLTSGPDVAVENGKAAASVTVDPAAAAALLSRHYAEIGATGGGATLTVTPVVADDRPGRGPELRAGVTGRARLCPGRRLPAADRGGVRLVRAPRSKANIQRLSCTFCVVPDRGLRLSEFQRIHWIHKRG